MATLYFKVSSDYDEVIRLRQECEKLEAQLKRMDVNKSPAAAKALETQLASTRQQMMSLVTEAGRVGAVMENDLKNKLNSASKASDELTEEIIKQRKIIRDTQDDIRRLSDEYSKMGKFSPNSSAKLTELNRAKAALNEQRYAMGELQDQQAKNRLEVRKLTREYKEFAQGGSNADEVVKSLTDSLKRTAAEFGGLVAIKKFVSDVIDATGKMQQLDVALSTILQSKSKADALLAEISEFAKKTPFNLDEVANGAKQLLAYGSSADNVVDELSMLGDVASGLQIPLGQLIYLYGTLRVQGRAYWRDIYNPQIQIFAKSETKRHFFECSFKTKRSKKDLHTTQTIKPEIRAKKLYSGLCQKLFNRQYNCIQTMFKQHCYKCFHPAFYITLYLYIWQHNSCVR